MSIRKLLFVTVLCVALWTSAEAEKKVTVTSFNVDVPSNDIVDSWNHGLDNNLISSTLTIKRDCPGVFEADVKIFEGGNQVQQVNTKLKQPIKDFESYNLCASVDGPDPNDDQCSILEGEQSARDCDLTDLFKDKAPGEYSVVTDFTQDDQNVGTVTIDVLVEGNDD